MKSELKSLSKNAAYYLTNYFPLAFCMAVCFGFRAAIGIIFSCLTILFAPDIKSNKIMPLIISFFILGSNIENSLEASLICGILLIISSFCFNKLKKLFYLPAISGIMLAGALTVTVMFTTNYFGIGATGGNVTEMIKSYISLGFHPNWRGVLYGTIVLVIMITFPRKFKSFNKYVSAPFIALFITLILNLFLNPSYMITSISEIPYSDTIWIKDYFISRTELNFSIETVLIGLSLFVICFYSVSTLDSSNRNDFIACGVANTLSAGLIGFPLPYGVNKNSKTIISRIIAATILLVIFFIFDDILLRIPVHSCAVVIIVSAWESVKWSEIKKTFAGISPLFIFVISIIICLLSDMVYGILSACILSAINYGIKKYTI